MKILMVCLGNICRSPLAEGILKQKIKEKGLPWTVDSAGTGAWHIGELPDARSIAVAHKYGIDLTYQRARQFKAADFNRFDKIFAMDRSNYRDILRNAPNNGQKEKLEMILNVLHPGSNADVPDPYWDDNGFEQVFRMLDKACEKIVDQNESIV